MRSGMGFPIPHFYAGSAGPIVDNASLTRGRQPTPTRQTGRSADDVAQAAGPAPELVLR